jgi:hypothetical protein
MANINAPAGLLPISDNGTPWSGQGRLYNVASGTAVNIFIGDPVVATGASDAYGVPVCTIATAGDSNEVVGAMIGIANGPAGLAGNAASTVTRDLPVYRQASISNYIFVADDPNQLFAIQEDSVGGSIPTTAGGLSNGNLVSGSGSTYTGRSGWMLDSSTVGVGATTNQLRILGLLRAPGNALGNYATWVVRLNNGQLWSTTGV